MLRISSTSGPMSPSRRPRPHYCGRGRLAMRRVSGSGDLELLSAIRLRTSSPPVLFPASSSALSLKRLVGSFTTPPRDESCPLRTSLLTSPSPTTASSPTALPRSPPPPLFLAPGAAVVDPLPPQGAAPSSVSQVDPVEPVEVAVDSRPAVGAEPGGAEPGGAEPGGEEPGGAEPGGAEPGDEEPGGAEPGVAPPLRDRGRGPRSPESRGPESGGPVPESPTPGGALSSAQLREWYLQYCSLRRGTSGARRTTGAGASASPPR
ncbi:unnamed protein product [Closterium sp. NIES-53]